MPRRLDPARWASARPSRPLRGVAAACVALFATAASSASTLNILALGDSLTYGQGFDANFSNNLGYRHGLQEQLWNAGVDYDFVGGLNAGSFSVFDPSPLNATVYTGPYGTLTDGDGNTRPIDLDHFGWPGAQAGTPGGTVASRDLLAAIQGRNQEQTLDFRVGNGFPYTSGWQDVNPYGGLIQQHGSDFHAGPNPGEFWDQAALDATTNPNADASWLTPAAPDVVLLHIGTNTINSAPGSSNTALTQYTDLLEQLQTDWTNGRIAPDAQFFVANIIPKAAPGTGDTSPNFTTVNESYLYNLGLEAIADDARFTQDFRDAITYVDMFAVDATQDLADFVGTSLSALDPNSDGYVDWLTGSYNPSTGQGVIDDANLDLWGVADFIHPEELGYRVMAYQWFDALDAAGLIGGLIELLAGDFNGSGTVEQGDLDLVLTNWGSDRGAWSNAEGFASLTVDQEELDAVLTNWGGGSAPSFTGFAVPEPAAALAVALLALAGGQRPPGRTVVAARTGGR